jgi:hypothetical protein
MAKQSQQTTTTTTKAGPEGEVKNEAPPSKARKESVAVEVADLVVIRGMPSLQHVLCSLGEAKNLVCNVRVASLFRKGMVLKGCRPRPDLTSVAWEYVGKLPRRPGIW